MIQIEDNFSITQFPIVENTEKQRTIQWYLDRWGKITSSKLSALCAPKGIGKEAITYLNGILYQYYNPEPSEMQLENMERDISYDMKAGKDYESEARNELSKKLGFEIIEVGFKDYPMFENKAGDSSDGIFLYKGINIPIELKCTSKPETFMKRSQVVSDKHQDFWQCQGHILAYDAPFCVYGVYDYSSIKKTINWQVVKKDKQELLISRIYEGLDLLDLAYKNGLMSVDDQKINYNELRLLSE